jgi:methionyl-tRNA formyltransferase
VHRASERRDDASLDIVFMGTPAFARVCLEALLASRHRVVAVVTQPDKPAGRGMKLSESAVKRLARERGIEVRQPVKLRDAGFVEWLRDLAPDLAVVVAYGRILPADVLAIPRLGCINAHASLLPALRGAAPIQRAIMEGLRETGVTIMRISEEMDAGDMLMSAAVEITADTDGPSLHDRLAETAAPLLVAAVDAIADGSAVRTPQDHAAATYAPPIRAHDARIDWQRSAAAIDRQIRALRPRPGAYTHDGPVRLKVLSARPHAGRSHGPGTSARPGTLLGAGEAGVDVACGDGVLTLIEVQPEGRKAMKAADYLRGRPQPLPRELDGGD